LQKKTKAAKAARYQGKLQSSFSSLSSVKEILPFAIVTKKFQKIAWLARLVRERSYRFARGSVKRSKQKIGGQNPC
jgi:hypothetical protein